jgi:hypothetical protein
MSSTAEERAAEEALQYRFLDALTESLTGLPLPDLKQWNFRAQIWKALDPHIDAILSQAKGRRGVAKFLALATIYKLSNMLLGGEELPCGETDKQILARSKEPQPEPVAEKPKPTIMPLLGPMCTTVHTSTRNRQADGSYQVSFTRDGKTLSFTARRRSTYPTYQEMLARRSPEQQAEFRRKRALLSARYRARKAAADSGGAKRSCHLARPA